MNRLGVVRGTTIEIQCDDTFTEFYVQKISGLTPITLEQLKAIYVQRGIDWQDPTIGIEMEEFLSPNRPRTDAAGHNYRYQLNEEDYPEDTINDDIWDEDNVEVGSFVFRGAPTQLGYQNSSENFFTYDGDKMELFDESAVRVLIRGKNITWSNEDTKREVYEMLEINPGLLGDTWLSHF